MNPGEPRHYILNGYKPVPCDFMTWAQWFEKNDRRVEFTVLEEAPNEVQVSTVFLGLDHRLFGDGPPLLFETMVFGGELAGDMERTSTWAEAKGAHVTMVNRVRETMKTTNPPDPSGSGGLA